MRVAAFTLFIFSLPVIACPNLSGRYAKCVTNSGDVQGPRNIEITQSVRNRVTTYVSSSTDEYQDHTTVTYRADGRVNREIIKDPESGMSLETLSTFSCTRNNFIVNSEMRFMGEVAKQVKTYSKASKQLVIERMEDDGEDQYRDILFCE